MPRWWVYLLRCRDGSLYCGITTDVPRRVGQHNAGKGAKYIVPARRPAACAWKRSAKDHSAALKLEHRIKRFATAAKEALVLNPRMKLAVKKAAPKPKRPKPKPKP